MNGHKAIVKVRETNESKSVIIGSQINNSVCSSIIENWQTLIDTVANIVDVPSGLIMKLNEDTIEVFVKSQTEGNPYKVGEEVDLNYGLYCENVIGKQEELVVSDATKDPIWKENNPDIDINMISYLGYPINWPDGKVFGTVCLLDNKENYYNEKYKKLLYITKKHIESDLQLIVSRNKLEELNFYLKENGSIKTRFLSLISHDVRGGIATLNEFLKLIISKFDSYEIEKLKKDLIVLHYMTDAASETLENLLSWSKKDLLHLEPEKKQFDVVKTIEGLLSFFKLSIKMKNIELIKDYSDSKVIVFADEEMVRSSLRNIISNAIKYNKVDGKLNIEITKKDKYTNLIISDTGIGMDKSTMNNLFTYSKSHQSKGTSGENSSGLGLFLTKDFLEKNNISINVYSNVGIGTKIELIFNISV